jgi:hypothetical protein
MADIGRGKLGLYGNSPGIQLGKGFNDFYIRNI